ncbi:MAG: Fe-S cluster assembly protein SufB [Candidatus Moranbacteria bacterium]|nr:Fe-S cluster assembly protein SufB [Candidatus Moranbacteria bacterium]
MPNQNLQFNQNHNFSKPEVAFHKIKKGLNKKVVETISNYKKEDSWMKESRLKAYKIFQEKKLPNWGPDLSKINFDEITYFLKATEGKKKSWEELPTEIKETYEAIGVPEHEKKWLSGVSAQYESEVVYESIQKDLEEKGVIFCDMDTAVKKYPNIVKKYFRKLIPPTDNKFAALNTAVWSGGTFIYIPENVKVELPLQAYFRINQERFGQFERTLIIADKNSSIHYIEGCTAPTYSTNSLHAAVVEIFALENARVRYTTIQNWSNNIYNLVTKRARAEKKATVEWVDCNIGSAVTMKYPAILLAGEKARGELLSISLAGENQHQDTGGKMIHFAPNTISKIINKSIAKDGGRSSYRGLVDIKKNAENSKNYTQCDALILDDISQSDTYPKINQENKTSIIAHEASTEKIDKDKIFYLMSRGLSKDKAQAMIINGFFDSIIRKIPLEYSVELYRLINLEMKKSVG